MDSILKAVNVTKYYGTGKNRITGCSGISFELPPGRITALLGLNGAGKSSIINCISGYCVPDDGEIFIGGYSVLKNPIEAKRRFGILYEQTPLYPSMTVIDFLNFAAEMHGIEKSARAAAVNNAMEFCEIEDVKDRKISGLSKGYKQRTGLAQAVLHNAPLIILDEPVSGLDAMQVRSFEKKILQIAKEKTILISTHNLRQAEKLCSNHILINKGTMIALGSLAEIKERLSDAGCKFEDDSYDSMLEKAFGFFAGINKNEFTKPILE